ncbi:biotin--[acetyl-CoA-carboxylase] ligase [Streptomyces aidingensis]|uniref:biotin--[biotin carboxyl-carrier protein] ligase n=1 Tax=Streptomyces aidingensis TaxID=910347 RepID=A0A1I1EK87_9ACTN|nr:biotin--[acetyl-CoA-carboxylase] ligase [Streptomyces aidingensis]SFB87579.1 BirA family transcriptional regulator, biotin operon repressor / biotin-[acetyl-CoA-carboxylase] ligase [Streptomyces aidingensis]
MTPPPSGPYDPTGPSGPWSDLERPPLNAAALRRALVTEDGLWTRLEVAGITGSTNADLRERAREGHAAAGSVLIAEEQTQGRGRLGRTWSAPARSGLFCSVLLTPGPAVPGTRWGWLPLLAGVAVADGVARVAGVRPALKWPNDLLVTVDGAERKLGGILAERTALADGTAAVVLGMGINVSLRAAELPVPEAGSLLLAGAPVTDRDPLLRAVLRSLADWYGRWRTEAGDPAASGLLEAYTAGCATLGRRVRALLPGGEELRGEAVALDGDGRLVIAAAGGGRQPVAAADIVHLRPDGG